MDSSAPLHRKKIISQSQRPHWYSWDKRFVTEQQHPANANFIHSFQKVKQCCSALLCPESKWKPEPRPWCQAASWRRRFAQEQGLPVLCLGEVFNTFHQRSPLESNGSARTRTSTSTSSTHKGKRWRMEEEHIQNDFRVCSMNMYFQPTFPNPLAEYYYPLPLVHNFALWLHPLSSN